MLLLLLFTAVQFCWHTDDLAVRYRNKHRGGITVKKNEICSLQLKKIQLMEGCFVSVYLVRNTCGRFS